MAQKPRRAANVAAPPFDDGKLGVGIDVTNSGSPISVTDVSHNTPRPFVTSG